MKCGQQKRIPTPGQNQVYHLFGALNWRTQEVVYHFASHKNSNSFIEFIEHLMASVTSDVPIVLVMDNASYHHSYLSKAALAVFENRSILSWLPPYCSDLNPIERFWKHLKQYACANRLFKLMTEVLHFVKAMLDIQNDLQHPDRLLFSKTF
jgi:transposase